ncbi:FAD-dependent oxidoreductase [Agrobacterium tumefaciens]|uniref:FAD-dependent oxidoreductase n=1 Tax=Agrobacterium tumefaciens TaxID=358 RepID=UPI00157383E6|nr:FAD-dependent oxidoreductase [Agrobacterium tumefaciens]NTA50003.1 FAD-dependent oxidoreductase [Agrobacterium tumefaciens]
MKYDVVVIGAGPAGMAASVQLRRKGLSVAVVDEQPSPGGQIWRGVERNSASPIYQALGSDYQKGRELVDEFRESGTDYCPNTQLWQIEEGWNLFVTAGGKARAISARAVLLATGAQERPVPFPGWTLPGVMTVGAAQILLKSGEMLPQGKVWIAGAGPLPLLYATQLLNLGGTITGYIDTSRRPGLSALSKLPQAWRDTGSLFKGLGWMRELRRKVRIIRNVENFQVEGTDKLEHVVWQCRGGLDRAAADVLLVHEGVVPRIHESLALGCEHHWNSQQGYYAPKVDRWGETSRKSLFVAGDATGIGGWSAAVVSGEIAALGILQRLGTSADFEKLRRDAELDGRAARALALRPFLDTLYAPPCEKLADDVIVCRCEEVTAGAIRAVAKGNPADPNVVKGATRCGMGPCQGRQCGYTVQSLLAEVHGIPASKVSYFNIRPPLKPVTIGEIAALDPIEVSQ